MNINDEEETGFKSRDEDMEKFKHAIKFGTSKQWSSHDMFVFMNLILDGVDREDKFVSRKLIDSWKTKIGAQAKELYEQKYTNIPCITIDGKSSDTANKHNQKVRKHHLTMHYVATEGVMHI